MVGSANRDVLPRETECIFDFAGRTAPAMGYRRHGRGRYLEVAGFEIDHGNAKQKHAAWQKKNILFRARWYTFVSSMELRAFQRLCRNLYQVHDFNIMFCRVCRFRVRVWECYGTSRSFGYGHGSVTELTEVPGIVARAYRAHKSSGRIRTALYATGTELPVVPGTGMNVVYKFQKFQVQV